MTIAGLLASESDTAEQALARLHTSICDTAGRPLPEARALPAAA